MPQRETPRCAGSPWVNEQIFAARCAFAATVRRFPRCFPPREVAGGGKRDKSRARREERAFPRRPCPWRLGHSSPPDAAGGMCPPPHRLSAAPLSHSHLPPH